MFLNEYGQKVCRKGVKGEVKVNNIIGSITNAMDRVMVDLFAHVGKM